MIGEAGKNIILCYLILLIVVTFKNFIFIIFIYLVFYIILWYIYSINNHRSFFYHYYNSLSDSQRDKNVFFFFQNHPNWSCTFVAIQRIARGFDKGLVKWSRSKIQRKENNHDKVIGALTLYASLFVELPLHIHFFVLPIFFPSCRPIDRIRWSRVDLTRVIFAKGTTAFRVEALAFEILLAHLKHPQKK